MLVKESLLVENYVVYQDDELYRFTSDAALLSRFPTVRKGDTVADFCSGCGIVGLNLFALNKTAVGSVTLFEMQKPLHDLAVRSVEENGLKDRIFPKNLKVQEIGGEYAGRFSLIVCNPPYEKVGSGETNKREDIAVCRTEKTLSLKELCAAFSFAVKFGGRVAISNRADRVAEVFYELKKNGIEPKRLELVFAGESETPYLALIEGVKGGKTGLKITTERIKGGK